MQKGERGARRILLPCLIVALGGASPVQSIGGERPLSSVENYVLQEGERFCGEFFIITPCLYGRPDGCEKIYYRVSGANGYVDVQSYSAEAFSVVSDVEKAVPTLDERSAPHKIIVRMRPADIERASCFGKTRRRPSGKR